MSVTDAGSRSYSGHEAGTMRVTDAVTDDQVLLAAAAHDVTAFETFYRRHVGKVTAFAMTRCGSAADVADVVAQTFVRLMQVAERYDPGRGEPLAFLLGIASNIVRDQHRGVARRRALVHRLVARDLLDSDEMERVDAALDAARLAPAARAALDGLPEPQEEVLRKVADGASPTEAAEALGISPAAARARLFRARRKVQSELAGEESP